MTRHFRHFRQITTLGPPVSCTTTISPAAARPSEPALPSNRPRHQGTPLSQNVSLSERERVLCPEKKARIRTSNHSSKQITASTTATPKPPSTSRTMRGFTGPSVPPFQPAHHQRSSLTGCPRPFHRETPQCTPRLYLLRPHNGPVAVALKVKSSLIIQELLPTHTQPYTSPTPATGTCQVHTLAGSSTSGPGSTTRPTPLWRLDLCPPVRLYR